MRRGRKSIDTKILSLILSGEGIERSQDYRRGEEASLALPELIYEYVDLKHSFFLGIIVGMLGAGKSYYALKSAYYYLRLTGHISPMPMEKALKHVFDNYLVFFGTREEHEASIAYFLDRGEYQWAEIMNKLDSLEEKLHRVNYDNRYPILIWDDAGVAGSSYRFFIDKTYVLTISNLIQIARRRTKALLITTPHPEMVLKAMRGIPERHIIVVETYQGWTSRARGYKYILRGYTSDIVKLVYEDFFTKKVPDEFHRYYMMHSDAYIDASFAIIQYIKNIRKKEKEIGEVRDRTIMRMMKNNHTLMKVFMKIAETGEARNTELAAELGVSKGRISQIIRELESLGLITKNGRLYMLTETGERIAGYITAKQSW